jgi:hypothetical protein
LNRSCSGYAMCCQVHPPHAPTPGLASMPKWLQRGTILCGDPRRILTSDAIAWPRPRSTMRT